MEVCPIQVWKIACWKPMKYVNQAELRALSAGWLANNTLIIKKQF